MRWFLLFVTIAAATQLRQPKAWWKEGVVYQVYPASFKESRSAEDAIGWGDINGIFENLDHIQMLGADIIWLSPFYDSPLFDLGYDISNYTSVNAKFGGSLKDIKKFIHEVHKRGMRCIFDLVINHTSDDHPWFKESKSSVTSPKRDWYFWRQPQYKNGTRYPPNNWVGYNGESAWVWDKHTGEYYLGIFSPYQVDLNWDNPDVREAVYQDALRIWLDMGIDGFRIDVISYYSKTPGLPNVPANDDGFYSGAQFYVNGPNEHKYLQEMNQKVLSHYDAFTVGEYANATTNMTIMQEYVGAHRREIDTIFYFNMVGIGRSGYEPIPWNLSTWRDTLVFNDAIRSSGRGDGWNTVFLENHDTPRSVSIFGDDSPEYRVQSAKLLSMLLSTLSGTLFLFQGQELGMINVPSTWNISDYQDYLSQSYYDGVKTAGGNTSQALSNVQKLARDNARMPFNWNSTYGFSANKTAWLPQVHPEINLADQMTDSDSVYNFWRSMLDLRKYNKDLFVYGDLEFVDNESETFMVYRKTAGCECVLVVLNFSDQVDRCPVAIPKGARLLAGTHRKTLGKHFEAFEGRVYRY
ncbi:glycoside hydrolase family 13 protein [Zasmidium cellare ATCC 36951]|uniref:Glycoside hydrolase family 13 protein n=1 Tax=Zasmidium cellare ATCC 36951 TaxID=1080233 RepID=A0A6A6CSQ3_ZASCE|nr:glycoside hydrolase family 13 protein [Zasmidium cellare ATCC 36951]KAF2168852.1 glycoside hydrolase family 13 protein [Zasmidium cellare ATCC 36951]